MFFYGSGLVFMVFHGSRWVFLVFHGSRFFFSLFRVGFHDCFGSRSVVMVGPGSRLLFHDFLRMYLPEPYPGLTIQFRSTARRAAYDLVPLKCLFWKKKKGEHYSKL